MQPKLKFAQRIKLFGRNWFDVTCRDVMQFPGGELREPWNKGRTWKQTTVNSGRVSIIAMDGIFVKICFIYHSTWNDVGAENVSIDVAVKMCRQFWKNYIHYRNFYRTFVKSTFFSKLISFWKKWQKGSCTMYICHSEIIKLQFFKWNSIHFFFKWRNEWIV